MDFSFSYHYIIHKLFIHIVFKDFLLYNLFNMNQLIQQIEREHIRKISSLDKYKNFNVGDDIIVNITIMGEKGSRIQKFTGRCIGIRNKLSSRATFKVLKLEGTKVVRSFPLYSPLISIEVKTKGYARRAKLNYLIAKSGKALRIRMPKIIKVKKNSTGSPSSSLKS
jgi:large subunit ribosomal protein L19